MSVHQDYLVEHLLQAGERHSEYHQVELHWEGVRTIVPWAAKPQLCHAGKKHMEKMGIEWG